MHTSTMTVSLSLALNNYDHVRDVISGEVQPKGIELLPLELPIEKVDLHLPAGVRIERAADKTLLGMLAAGELDAVMSAREILARRLFSDYRAAEAEYWKKTRIFPIMHVLIIRRDIYEQDRWIA